MKNKSPAFQFYADDWLGSTSIMLMTPAEEGAYIRLLAIAWNASDCGLPDDDAQLAVLSRLGEGWFNGGAAKVRTCFFARGGRLFNKRLLAERKKQAEWKAKSSLGGLKSAKARADKRLQCKGGSRVVDDCLQPNGNSPSPSPSPSPITSSKSILVPDDFAEFWKEYPNKKKKQDALKAWKKAKTVVTVEKMMNAVRAQKRSKQWLKNGGEFIPHPATWLNGGSWDDEITSDPRNQDWR